MEVEGCGPWSALQNFGASGRNYTNSLGECKVIPRLLKVLVASRTCLINKNGEMSVISQIMRFTGKY